MAENQILVEPGKAEALTAIPEIIWQTTLKHEVSVSGVGLHTGVNEIGRAHV